MTKENLTSVRQAQAEFLADRPSMVENNKSVGNIIRLLFGETKELMHAVLDHLANPTDATLVDVEQEAADVFIYLDAMLAILGISVYDAVMGKIAFNTSRFKPSDFKELPYDQAYKKSKQREKQVQTKRIFYPESS